MFDPRQAARDRYPARISSPPEVAARLQPERILCRAIIAAVEGYYKLPARSLVSRTRRHAIAHPRQVAMLLMQAYTPASTTMIGRILGGRDHTTVLYGVRRALADADMVADAAEIAIREGWEIA